MRKTLTITLGIICLLFISSYSIQAARVTVAAPAFHAEDGSDACVISSGGWGDYIYRKAAATEDMFVAQCDLPHGYIINYFRVHYMDNDATYNMNIGLVRSNKYTGARNTVYMVSTSGDSASVQYLTDFSASPAPAYAYTNTDACNYTIFVRFSGTGSTQRLYGVTVVY